MLLAAEAVGLYGQRLAARTAPGSALTRRQNTSRYSVVENNEGEPNDLNVRLQEAITNKEVIPAAASSSQTHQGGNLSAVVDGEHVLLCHHCRLPLGEIAYAASNADELVHGECKAQCMIRDLQADELNRKREAQDLKQARRKEFDIGWDPLSTIPDNASVAAKLGCEVCPRGLACLVMEGNSIRVASTLEPAASINLEYLAIALQVRRTEGREPLFSLDPVEGEAAAEASMQMKRWEPEWLAGTSVGEVLFQADYHLKELSFGEYDQPVVGMKSCFDYSETDAEDTEWSAREWFVVRKAEMHISGDKVLVPYLKMGVEAREQVFNANGVLEDAPITRPDHPLVMYADAFSFSFDLIAERKSVVSQLREVAKAAIVAKYLLDSGTAVGDSWLAHEGARNSGCCSLEVPQLWNDRCFSKITLKDGSVQTEKAPRLHGLYGGVDFGIDRFRLSAPSRVATSVVAGRAVLGRPASTLMATSRTQLSVAPARQFARLSAPLSATLPTSASRLSLGMPRVAASLSLGVPQGVDLNLDSFNLSAPTQDSSHWQDTVQVPGEDMVVGSSFWAELDSKDSVFSSSDKSLLREVFNPHLSDRRADGDRFIPPRTSASCMERLRILVKAEQIVRQQRSEHFCNVDFDQQAPGPLFPASWTASFAIERDGDRRQGRSQALRDRHDLLSQTSIRQTLQESIKAAAPQFCRQTEDGTTFRIYKLASLEVRTIQPFDCGEQVVAVFSATVATRSQPSLCQAISNTDLVVKATEFVEFAPGFEMSRMSETPECDDLPSCRSFVVLETEGGHLVVVEAPLAESPEGSCWQENPASLEDRLSLARVLRTCAAETETETGSGARVGDLRGRLQLLSEDLAPGAAMTFSREVFGQALQALHVTSTSSCRTGALTGRRHGSNGAVPTYSRER